MKLGRSSNSTSGWSSGGGSVVTTSKPAPAICPLRSATTMAASSTSPPRAVLMSSGRISIIANSAAPIRLRVDGISGVCSVITSLTRSTSWNGV